MFTQFHINPLILQIVKELYYFSVLLSIFLLSPLKRTFVFFWWRLMCLLYFHIQMLKCKEISDKNIYFNFLNLKCGCISPTFAWGGKQTPCHYGHRETYSYKSINGTYKTSHCAYANLVVDIRGCGVRPLLRIMVNETGWWWLEHGAPKSPAGYDSVIVTYKKWNYIVSPSTSKG